MEVFPEKFVQREEYVFLSSKMKKLCSCFVHPSTSPWNRRTTLPRKKQNQRALQKMYA